MLKTALKLIKKIEENGYQAYIVGGFVRDKVLGITSNDIDICTSAKPSDIRSIFPTSCLPNEDYGSVTVVVKNIRFEITTFRKEITYLNNRKPVEFEYIDDLLEDLKRRDFKINTLCMDKDGNIIDLLDGNTDINRREINTVGDSYFKFSEDALRILRAVRFATILDFRLSSDVKQAILKTREYVKNLSFERKKEELNKIFASVHVKYGVKLLLELGLDKELELDNLSKIKCFDDIMGVWAQLNVEDIYPFSKNEKEIIKNIKSVLEFDNLDSLVLYRYGLYVSSIVADIKGIDRKVITKKYNELPIKGRSDILIDGDEIMRLLGTKPGKYLRNIISNIEEEIVRGNLSNDKDALKEYVLNYGGTQN